MAAPCVRMLMSGRVWRSCGALQAAGRRVATAGPSRASNAKTLHTKSLVSAKGEGSSYRGNVFIGGAKAQNPMKTVALAWAIGFPSGILLFLFAKSKVNERRLSQMKARQRMRDANKGQYHSERYKSE